MGRPAASHENREAGLLFAKAACATAAAGAPDGMVARNGPLSVFGALASCLPTIVRDDNGGPRDGLTCMELNKTLQKNGFQRKRNRRSAALNRSSDRFGAGMYLFHMCRWRDPSNEEDCVEMKKGWENLVRFNNSFGQNCSFERFCDVVKAIRVQWDPWTGRKRRFHADGTIATSPPPGVEDDEVEFEGGETDDDESPSSTRSDSTTSTVVKDNSDTEAKDCASRKRPIAEISADDKSSVATPAPGSADEMEKLRQELLQTKAALAMYQLSTTAAAQPPLPLPSPSKLTAGNNSSPLLPLPKPDAAAVKQQAGNAPVQGTVSLPLVQTALPQLSAPAPGSSMNLPVLQQLLQSQLMFLPQQSPSPTGTLPRLHNLNLANLAQLTGFSRQGAFQVGGLQGPGTGTGLLHANFAQLLSMGSTLNRSAA